MEAKTSDPTSAESQYQRGHRAGEYDGYTGKDFDYPYYERAGIERGAGYADGYQQGDRKRRIKLEAEAQDQLELGGK